jgi:ADP-ribose pyrophosphatase YjhB (NUDIX family)
MNFCSHCGSSELTTLVPPGENRHRLVCQRCGTIHYVNPKIITGCLPVWENKVLLCRRAIEPRLGLWNVPAGFLEIGETIEQGAAREVWEEAAAEVKIFGVLNVFTLLKYQMVYVHFWGELVNGAFGVGEESSETKLFSEAELHWQEIAFESSVFTLKKYFEDRRKGEQKVHIGAF